MSLPEQQGRWLPRVLHNAGKDPQQLKLNHGTTGTSSNPGLQMSWMLPWPLLPLA